MKSSQEQEVYKDKFEGHKTYQLARGIHCHKLIEGILKGAVYMALDKGVKTAIEWLGIHKVDITPILINAMMALSECLKEIGIYPNWHGEDLNPEQHFININEYHCNKIIEAIFKGPIFFGTNKELQTHFDQLKYYKIDFSQALINSMMVFAHCAKIAGGIFQIEQEIPDEQGKTLRIDLAMINPKNEKKILIDWKTGKAESLINYGFQIKKAKLYADKLGIPLNKVIFVLLDQGFTIRLPNLINKEPKSIKTATEIYIKGQWGVEISTPLVANSSSKRNIIQKVLFCAYCLHLDLWNPKWTDLENMLAALSL